MAAFEVFEHTADVGLRVWATSLNDLFREAGRGATALIVENPEAIRPEHTVTFDLQADEIADLFVDWLRELIYRFEVEHLLFADFAVSVDEQQLRLRAECRGEPADWTRHLPDNELKAVTYHALRVERTPTGWEAEVIFDI